MTNAAHHDDPWTLADRLGGFRNDVGTVKASLRLSVDRAVYVASYEQMVAIADLGITGPDWLAQTRQ